MAHERLTLADELAEAMLDAPDLCAQCGKPLTDDAQYLCDACTEAVYCADSDICEPWEVRFNPAYQPPDRYGISVLSVLLLATFLAACISTAGWQHVQAQDTRPARTVNGRIYTWPDIGTAQYTRGCEIVRAFEDGSATAWCSEDGALYVWTFDPDGQYVPNIPGNPVRQPGWYPMTTAR